MDLGRCLYFGNGNLVANIYVETLGKGVRFQMTSTLSSQLAGFRAVLTVAISEHFRLRKALR